MFRKFIKLFESPYAALIASFALLICGLFELSNTFLEDYFGFEVRVHHGVIIYAFIHTMTVTAQIIWGLGGISEFQSNQEVKEIKEVVFPETQNQAIQTEKLEMNEQEATVDEVFEKTDSIILDDELD